MENPNEASWRIGGAGTWWPGRKLGNMKPSEAEEKYTQYTQKEEGVMASTTFNSLMNSSTRCEMGAALVAISPDAPVHVGIDNTTTVMEGNNIPEDRFSCDLKSHVITPSQITKTNLTNKSHRSHKISLTNHKNKSH